MVLHLRGGLRAGRLRGGVLMVLHLRGGLRAGHLRGGLRADRLSRCSILAALGWRPLRWTHTNTLGGSKGCLTALGMERGCRHNNLVQPGGLTGSQARTRDRDIRHPREMLSRPCAPNRHRIIKRHRPIECHRHWMKRRLSIEVYGRPGRVGDVPYIQRAADISILVIRRKTATMQS
ncbi:hypothetical protein OUW_21974 [Mycobacteroides abscessus M93]|nr:hypothetical protein OUW_21974 [Mycobacteroides abscessus M93]